MAVGAGSGAVFCGFAVRKKLSEKMLLRAVNRAVLRAEPLLHRPGRCTSAHRSFLPGLSNAHGNASRRRSHKWQRIVQFPLERLYNVVADVESYDLFLPWCISSRVIERQEQPDGSETLQTQVCVGFQMMQSQFSSSVVLTPRTRVVAVSNENEYLEELSFSWDFAPIGDTACRLDLKLGAPCASIRTTQICLWFVRPTTLRRICVGSSA